MKISDFLQLEDYVPIDIDYVENQHKKIFNVPNKQWENDNDLRRDLRTINNIELPYILRLYLLNHLPFSIIHIINNR